MIKSFMNYAIDHGLEITVKSQSEENRTDAITFDKGGLHFVFLYDKDIDPNFFELVLPYIDDFDQNNTQQFDKITTMTKDYKTGKVIITAGNRVSLTFEQYVFSYENLNKLFEQGIGCLEAMIKDYRTTKLSSENFSKNIQK